MQVQDNTKSSKTHDHNNTSTHLIHDGRLIGYARVSTTEQELSLQLDALIKAGCIKKNIFVDKTSGVKTQRPGLDACLQELKSGDTLIVWRIDRLGRSIAHLVGLVAELLTRNISFKSICDGAIDTTSASGEFVFNIFSSLAQFERRLIQERTNAGLEAARARGRKGGRPALQANDPRVITAKRMYLDKSMDIETICKMLSISKATFYRYLSTV